MAGETYADEARIVAVVQKWLDNNWRRGKISAKAKASLCNSLLAATKGGFSAALLDTVDRALEDLENIRHVKSNCTTRFVNRLTEMIDTVNYRLDKASANCPRISIPLREGDRTPAQTAKVPEEYVGENRTLVPAKDITPVEIDTKGLGETVIRIVVRAGEVTLDLTQKRK